MSMAKVSKIIDLSSIKVACKDCSLFELCLPVGIDPDDLDRLDKIIKRRRPLARGQHLFHAGDKMRAIYAVRSGSVKTYTPTEDGHEQVTGFHLPGELVGLDSINTGNHPCAAVALETSSFCEIPFDRLQELSDGVPSLQRQLLRILSREIQQDHELLTLIGKRSAEERLAAFLISLSTRVEQRGFSPHEFQLSMSRNDIGNYLGLAVETVSRLFSRFQEQNLLQVQRKQVRLRDLSSLKSMAGICKGASPRASA